VLSYCESQQIDEQGSLLANNYHAYVSDIDGRHWLTYFVIDGKDEIINSLSIKNTIPNVSVVLFESETIKSILEINFDEICSYHIAGDWLVYVLVLGQGSIAFSPAPFNKHRRHNNSVTISNLTEQQLEEIRRMQDYVNARYSISQEKRDQAGFYLELLIKEI